MFRDNLFLIQLILLFGIYGVKSDNCLFIGCQCDQVDRFGSYVICKPSDTLPRDIFPNRDPNVSITEFRVIQFVNFEFAKTPSLPLFTGLNVTEIIFLNNSIETLSKENFQDMKYLNTLQIGEKKLNLIEPMTFAPIAESLKELKLKSGDYKIEKIIQFNENIRLLKNLTKLDLSYNKIESIDDTIFSELKNLQEVDLTANLISKIATNTFLNNYMIKTLRLYNNDLSNISDLLRALDYSISLDYLDLTKNNIEVLPNFPNIFDRLSYLVLSENKLTNINRDTFKNLKSLSYLYLDQNHIEKIDENAFEFLTRLSFITLRNNSLSSVPVIKNSGLISYLDLSHQNGKLKEIKDNSFQRDSKVILPMELLIIGNGVTFGKKAFCSDKQDSSYIKKLTVSYKTFNDMNICTIRQLESRYQYVNRAEINFITTESDTNLTACNCDLKSSFDFYNIIFPEKCNLTAECVNKVTEDVCLNQNDYSCPSFIYPSGQTTTISTTRISTTLTTTSASSSVKSNVAIFILNVFWFFILK